MNKFKTKKERLDRELAKLTISFVKVKELQDGKSRKRGEKIIVFYDQGRAYRLILNYKIKSMKEFSCKDYSSLVEIGDFIIE
jgi:hypothetical protein